MPHVEIEGAGELAGFHQGFRPGSIREGDTVLKCFASYLSHDGTTLLVECLVVEGYLRQGFFVLVTRRGERTVVRLLPRTSPEKTDGVKRCVAWVARRFQAGAARPGTIGSTNLGPILARPFPVGD